MIPAMNNEHQTHPKYVKKLSREQRIGRIDHTHTHKFEESATTMKSSNILIEVSKCQ